MSDKPKTKLEGKPDNCIIIDQPAVRTFSTGGGHGPEDTLVEGDEKLVTRKWQGYPPRESQPHRQAASAHARSGDTAAYGQS